MLRDISGQGLSTNRLVACYGQYLGTSSLDPQEACIRCLHSEVRAFGTCRVSGFVDGDKRYVLAKGSCMCCLFAGHAAKCSLRTTQPTWAVQFLLTLRGDFSYEIPDDEEAGGVSLASPSVTATTPRRSARASARHEARETASPSVSAVARRQTAASASEPVSSPAGDVGAVKPSRLTSELFNSPIAELWKIFGELSHDAAAHEREARALRSDADILRAEIRRREDAAINSGRAPEWNT